MKIHYYFLIPSHSALYPWPPVSVELNNTLLKARKRETNEDSTSVLQLLSNFEDPSSMSNNKGRLDWNKVDEDGNR